jgi:hypothetical protein
LSTWSKINNTTFNNIRLVLLNDMTKSKLNIISFLKGDERSILKSTIPRDYRLFAFLNFKYVYALNVMATITIQVRGNRIVLTK